MIIKSHPSVLTIAGSDSSGGAGIQADIKAISATGSYAASVITALTAQNTLGVQTVYPIPGTFVRAQITSVMTDLEIKCIKIGMLFNQEIMEAIASVLQQFPIPSVVLDPVMIAKSGCLLLQEEAIYYLKETLFPLCTLITPNLNEAEKLVGCSIQNEESMLAMAKELGERYKINVLIKGGHLETNKANDVLYLYREKSSHWFSSDRIESKNTHGTGCTLSAAIASYLAQNYSLVDAISNAKKYLTKSIQLGKQFKIGKGIGPVDHFHFGERKHGV